MDGICSARLKFDVYKKVNCSYTVAVLEKRTRALHDGFLFVP